MFGTIHFLPTNVDPKTVLPFTLSGQGSVAAAASSVATIASTTILTNYVGLILGLGVTVRGVPDYDWDGSLIFSLKLGGASFVDNNQGTWTAQRGSVVQPAPTFINLPLNSTVVFQATRSTAAAPLAQTVAVLAVGVMWPNNPGRPTDGARYRV